MNKINVVIIKSRNIKLNHLIESVFDTTYYFNSRLMIAITFTYNDDSVLIKIPIIVSIDMIS